MLAVVRAHAAAPRRDRALPPRRGLPRARSGASSITTSGRRCGRRSARSRRCRRPGPRCTRSIYATGSRIAADARTPRRPAVRASPMRDHRERRPRSSPTGARGRRARAAAPRANTTTAPNTWKPTSTAGIAFGVLHVAEDALRDHRRDRDRHRRRARRAVRAVRTSTTAVTSVRTTSRSTSTPCSAGEVGDRDAQALRVAVAAVRAGRGHERADDHDGDRPHVHDRGRDAARAV